MVRYTSLLSFLVNLKTFKLSIGTPWDDLQTVLSYTFLAVWIHFPIWSWNRWGYDKFPKETPLVFYREGEPIFPAIEMLDGLKLVLENMVSYIQKEVPSRTLKFWRLQSPRHFYGGDWNQNGSCLFNEPLKEFEVWVDDGYPHFRASLPRFYALFHTTNISPGSY